MKQTRTLIALLLIAMIGTSCATILGGKRTSYQTTKPADGQPQRKVRVGYIVTDVLLTGALGLIVDFATGAIYKPSAEGSKPATETK